MPSRTIDRIRFLISNHQYEMTKHAMEEMAEDNLTIHDIENAIHSGKIVRREKKDPRGTKYIIEGIAKNNKTIVASVSRFIEKTNLLIITVYAKK